MIRSGFSRSEANVVSPLAHQRQDDMSKRICMIPNSVTAQISGFQVFLCLSFVFPCQSFLEQDVLESQMHVRPVLLFLFQPIALP